jgi:tetratricopeptide (TPR) repeat protein
MHQFKQAKKLATKIYNQEKINIKGDHETHASALIQMSRAELGLGHSKEALGYAQKAKNICINDQNRHNDNLALSTDDLLSKGLVAEANALALLGKREEAVELYATAEAIYFNCYKKNIKYIDEISYLYLNAIKATCNLPDKFWYNYFYSQHIKYFGIEHPRSQEILTMSCSN